MYLAASALFCSYVSLPLCLACATDGARSEFLRDHCADCHSDGASEGGLDLDYLQATKFNSSNFAQ